MNIDHLKQIAQKAPQSEWESYTIPGQTARHMGKVLVGIGDDEVEVIAPEGGSLIARHIAAFDPPTVQALITRIEELEAENERLRERQESDDLANEAIRWKREALNTQDTIQRVRDARSNHPEIPECDRYTDDDTIKCGWRSAIESIDKALEGDQK